MRILITGFDPFGGETINPAWEAVKRLPDMAAGAQLIKLEVPTAFSRCGPAMAAAIETHRPDAVVCVGQAGGRACVTVERVAVNLADAAIPDNEGEKPVDVPIRPDGPAAYFSTLPVKAIVQHIRAHGLPCQLSYTAGTFVCNCLMYQVLHLAAVQHPQLRAGFLHVPFIEEQAAGKPGGTPSASLASITKALKLACEAIAAHPNDTHESMGHIC